MKGLIFDRSFFDVDDVTVTVVSGGGYQNSWHDPLVNGLNAAASILAKCENVTIQTPCTNPEYPCPCEFSDILVPSWVLTASSVRHFRKQLPVHRTQVLEHQLPE